MWYVGENQYSYLLVSDVCSCGAAEEKERDSCKWHYILWLGCCVYVCEYVSLSAFSLKEREVWREE